MSADWLRVLRQSLTFYRDNLLLFVPVLVSIVLMIAFSYGVGDALQQLAAIVSAKTIAQPTEMMELLSTIMPYLLAFAFVNFLANLGLIAMVDRIVTEGTCKLSDWVIGIKNYFWRIFNVSVIVTFFVGLFSSIPMSVSSYLPGIVIASVSGLINALGQLLLYFCYGAIMIDDADLQLSLNLAMKVMRESGRNFWILFGLYFIVIEVGSLLAMANPFATGISLSFSVGLLNTQNVVYGIIRLLLVPVWLLLVFIIYRKIEPRKAIS